MASTKTKETTSISDNENETTSEQVSFSELANNFDDLMKKAFSSLREAKAVAVEMSKQHKADVRDAKKNRRSKTKNDETKKDPSGFNKPQKVPIEFCKQPWGCSKDQELPRTVLTKMVYDYIKENGLQSSEDKRVINSDKNIKELFHLNADDVLEFKNFQTYMARLYKRETLESSADEGEASSKESGDEKKTNSKTKKNKKSKNATASV